MQQQNQQQTPEWLKRTQEGSWEPEILISGIVLLALTQVPRLLRQLHYWLEERTARFYFYTSDIDDIIIDTLILSAYWLIAGLIFHLIMRSLWVSFVGLSFAFPNGINTERLKIQPWFKQRLASITNFQESIVKLENFCSTLYATAFLFVMATFSLCLFLIFCLFIALFLASLFPVLTRMEDVLDNAIGAFTIVFALPYFIDFISLGSLKRIPWFWRIYKYPYRLMSTITLASVYRGIYYGLISNLSRWRIGMLMTIYLVITYFAVSPSASMPWQTPTVYNTNFGLSGYDGYYRDQQPERFSTWAHIQSQQIDGAVLHVFLPHKLQYEASILESCDANLAKRGMVDSFPSVEERNLGCLAAVYSFYIDGVQQKTGPFFMRELAHTKQLGLETWMDITHIPRGFHVLQVKVLVGNEERLRAAIPFFQVDGKESSGPPTADSLK